MQDELKLKMSAGFLKELLVADLDPGSADNFDPKIVDHLAPLVDLLGRNYFRSRVGGLENIPKGPALIIGNHNAGITFLEPFIMAAEYYKRYGREDPIYFIAHDAMVSVPLVKNILMKGGAIRGSHENSHKVLDRGRKLVIFPGGNHEAFRTYKNRYKVDFGGHKGFARLALERNVPIVPMACVGGHETFFVLTPGEKLAKIFKTDKYLRSKTCAVTIALPLGISVGPIFHLPLPAKLEVELGPAIHPAEAVKGAKTWEEKIDRVYDAAAGAVQEIMTRVSDARKYPVIG